MEDGVPGMFAGVRVVELAQFVFVPSAGMLLADWGADVIKIEHPTRADGYRGLATQGIGTLARGVNVSWEMVNRGKRSVALDVTVPEAKQVLFDLIESADVFLTNVIPASVERLGFGVEAVRQANPNIIYARGHGFGVRGPDAAKPAYDVSGFWARGGFGHILTPPGSPDMVGQRPAFGDRIGGGHLAFGVAAALYRRAMTGQPSVVDVSLLSTAMWVLTADVLSALQGAGESSAPPGGWPAGEAPNPLTSTYMTQDRRFLTIALLQADRYWSEFCTRIGRPDMVDDPRFADMASRRAHKRECASELEATFRLRSLEEWTDAFQDAAFAWAPVANMTELIADRQVAANDYIGTIDLSGDEKLRLPTGPVQFDGQVPQLRRAPEHGQDTEMVLLERGRSWDDIADLKAKGAIL